jgi:hypothetical protein
MKAMNRAIYPPPPPASLTFYYRPKPKYALPFIFKLFLSLTRR